MIVEKVQDTSGDGLPIGTILIWNGRWDRSPEDCWLRDRDAMPVLHEPGGDPAPPTFASDWIDVATQLLLEHWYWIELLRRRLLEEGYVVDRLKERLDDAIERIDFETSIPQSLPGLIDLAAMVIALDVDEG
jgi:hypothetical protein